MADAAIVLACQFVTPPSEEIPFRELSKVLFQHAYGGRTADSTISSFLESAEAN
jgi:hypothetical protein